MSDHPTQYRPNVGLVVINAQGQAWLGKRHGSVFEFAWQFPQGGVDEGEALEVAARRELQEETGIVNVTYLGQTKDWIYYDFPPEVLAQKKIGKNFKGQKQIWFLYRFEGRDEEIDLSAHHEVEFDQWIWCDLDQVVDRVVPFKRDSYIKVLDELRPLLSSL